MSTVGLDWGSAEHAACIVDAEGQILAQLSVAHTADGLQQLMTALARIAPAEQLPVAIERPSGLVVDTLAEAGYPIVPIHPNALKASRPRYRAAGGKSDPGDAYILADLLRTDGHRFRPLQPLSDDIRALRVLVRTRDDLVEQRVRAANQLRALLDGFWPGAAAIFADVDSPIALTFLERYPTPSSAERLGPKRLAAFLARSGYCGRRRVADLLQRLRRAPVGQIGPREEEARGDMVTAQVAVLRILVDQIKPLTASIEHAVGQLPTGQVVSSFPRAGKLNAAQIVAELGEDPERFATDDQLAAESGTAPVTYESGKHRGVVFRFACNKRLRRALTCFADNSRHGSAWANHIYAKARARGCDHAHAVRILARAWVRVLWRCWRNQTTYDAALHGAAKPFLQAA